MRNTCKYLAFCLLVLATACTYDFEADLDGDTTITVIDGMINAGGNSTVTVYRAQSLSGDTSESVSGVTGYLECEDGSRIEGTSPSPSGWEIEYSLPNYINLDTRDIQAGKKYRLHLNVGDSEQFDSDWMEIHDAPVIDGLRYKSTETGLQFYLSAHSNSSPYFIVNTNEAWEYTSLITTAYEYIPPTNPSDERDFGKVVVGDWIEHPTYRCWRSGGTMSFSYSAASHTEPTLKDVNILAIDRRSQKISVLYRLIVSVGTASPEYQEYWDNLERISHISGDLFTPIPSNMEGNIHRTRGKGQVMGFIGSSRMSTDTIFYKNKGFYKEIDGYQTMRDFWLHHFGVDPEHEHDDRYNYYVPKKEEWPKAWSDGNIPIREAENERGIIEGFYIWGMKECVDCRHFGGDTTFPADWPDRNTID